MKNRRVPVIGIRFFRSEVMEWIRLREDTKNGINDLAADYSQGDAQTQEAVT